MPVSEREQRNHTMAFICTQFSIQILLSHFLPFFIPSEILKTNPSGKPLKSLLKTGLSILATRFILIVYTTAVTNNYQWKRVWLQNPSRVVLLTAQSRNTKVRKSPNETFRKYSTLALIQCSPVTSPVRDKSHNMLLGKDMGIPISSLVLHNIRRLDKTPGGAQCQKHSNRVTRLSKLWMYLR